MPVVNGSWVSPDKAWLNGPVGIPMPIKIRGGKDAWDVNAINATIETPIHSLCLARGMAMDLEQNAVEITGQADDALKTLKATLDKFKASIGNDLTSIKAAGTRIQSETLQIKQAYQATQALLTTPEFEKAILNAERMAAALTAISELSETKLSVAVFSGGKATAVS